MPNTAARTATRPFAFVLKAALVLVLVEAPVPVLVADAPVGGLVAVGTPKPVMLPVKGPGMVDADAPWPTRKPTDC